MNDFIATMRKSAERGDVGITTLLDGVTSFASWQQVHESAVMLAVGLLDADVSTQSSAGLLVRDPALTAVACQAVWLAGGSVTALHQPTNRISLDEWLAEVADSLRIIGATHLLVDESFAGIRDDVERVLPSVTVVVVDGTGDGGRADESRLPEVDQHTVALRQLTSGSTGSAKAVLMTHEGLFANLVAISERLGLSADDTFVSWLPIFHDMGMVGFLTLPMVFGVNSVKTVPAEFVQDPLVWLRLISDHRGTVTSAPNFAYAIAGKRLARAAERFDLSSLRVLMSGAEPIDPTTIEAFVDAAGAHGLRTDAFCAAAGMAEVGVASAFEVGRGLTVDTVDAAALAEGLALAASVGTEATVRLTKLGSPVPGLDVKVVDEHGTALGERQVGELCFRGASVTSGYQTAAGTVDIRDGAGWIRTGDTGYVVDDEIVICGRSKDILIVRGRNILPTEVERAAERAEAVRPGSAIAARLDAGMPGERFVVLVESRNYDDEAQSAAIRLNVSKNVVDAVQARPHDVLVLPPATVPKTSSGKVRRSAAATLYLHAQARETVGAGQR